MKLIDIEKWRKTYDAVTCDLNPRDHYDNGFDDALDFVDDWLDSQTDESRWISVKDGMPDEFATVLCYYRWKPIMPDEIKTNVYHGGRWLDDTDRITHWMPLPEPPEEAHHV